MTGPTHEVTNQPSMLVGHDLLATDAALLEAVQRYGGAGAVESVTPLAKIAGTEQAQRWGVEANANPPTLRSHDRYGHRVDEVDFHPSWHALLDVATSHGLHGTAWRDSAPSPHVRRAAGFLVWSQVEAGHWAMGQATLSAPSAGSPSPLAVLGLQSDTCIGR